MISRRAFVAGFAAGFAARGISLLAWPRAARAMDSAAGAQAAAVLEASKFAYVSPLRSDGEESACHGEVWFAWVDGAVLTTTGVERWKVRAVAKGLDRARLWIGDFGRWKYPGGKNEAFRRGLRFDASASRVEDASVLDRILAVYEKKYPEEIGRWRDRMREEVAAGKRVILRYQPLGG